MSAANQTLEEWYARTRAKLKELIARPDDEAAMKLLLVASSMPRFMGVSYPRSLVFSPAGCSLGPLILAVNGVN